MIRLLVVLTCLAAAAGHRLAGQPLGEPEKKADALVDPIREIQDETARVDALGDLFLRQAGLGCGNLSAENLRFLIRLQSRLEAELDRQPQAVTQLETRIIQALKAGSEAKTAAELETVSAILDDASRKLFVILQFRPSPKLPGIMKRLLAEADRSKTPALEISTGFNRLLSLISLTLDPITIVYDNPVIRPHPKGIAGWREWFASESPSGLWFRIGGFPGVHRVE